MSKIYSKIFNTVFSVHRICKYILGGICIILIGLLLLAYVGLVFRYLYHAHLLFAIIIGYVLISSLIATIGISITVLRYMDNSKENNHRHVCSEVIMKVCSMVGIVATFNALTLVQRISVINTGIIYFVTSFLVIIFLSSIAFSTYNY